MRIRGLAWCFLLYLNESRESAPTGGFPRRGGWKKGLSDDRREQVVATGPGLRRFSSGEPNLRARLPDLA
jgi:hypothetical protein